MYNFKKNTLNYRQNILIHFQIILHGENQKPILNLTIYNMRHTKSCSLAHYVLRI